MNKTTTYLLRKWNVFFLLLFTACSIRESLATCLPGATAGFTYSLHTAPNYLIFNASFTSPGYSHQWKIDGVNYSGENVQWFYSAPGYHAVCHRILNLVDSCIIVHCDTILIPNTSHTCNANFLHNIDSNGIVHLYPVSPDSSTMYYWSFGDGSMASQPFTQHQYTMPGSYVVCLTVLNLNGSDSCFAQHCDTITIPNTSNTCNANFLHNIDSSGIVHLYPSTPPHSSTRYYWSFGDGSTASQPFTQHQYTMPGSYVVCLTVWNLNGSDSCFAQHCDTITIPNTSNTCNANFLHNIDYNGIVHLYPVSADSSAMYYWSFGDGSMASQPFTQHQYTMPGSYVVCLTVWNLNGSDSCFAHHCDTIMIPNTSNMCNANFLHNIDSNGIVHLYPSTPPHSNTMYYWSFGDSATASQPFTQHQYIFPGSYVVCLTIWNLNGSDSCFAHHCDTIMIPNTSNTCNANFLHNIDSNGIVHLYPSTPPHSSTMYYWSFGDGSMASQPFTQHQYILPGSYIVCLTVLNFNGSDSCFAQHCDTIMIPNTSNTCNAKFLRQLDSNGIWHLTPLMVDSSMEYHWDLGDGTTSSQPFVIHQYVSPDAYQVCLTVRSASDSCQATWCESLWSGSQHTALKEEKHLHAITSLYPNPVENELHLKLNMPASDMLWIRIYNLTGQLAFEERIAVTSGASEYRLNTSSLTQGMYIIEIKGTETLDRSRFLKKP